MLNDGATSGMGGMGSAGACGGRAGTGTFPAVARRGGCCSAFCRGGGFGAAAVFLEAVDAAVAGG